MIFLKISSATLILSLFAVATISNLLPLSAGFAPSSNSNIAPQAVRRKVLVPRTGVEESLSSTTSSLFAKKILLSFDGTGNSQQDYDPDNDRSITNILKLHLLAGGSIDGKTNHFSDQICLYEKGVGTRPTRKFAKSMRFALGDLNLQIKPMHKRLEDVYDEGDKLYMIGFSRGAASARLFASQLHENGLKTKNGKKVQSPPIEFVGCFDTVSMQVSKNLATISRTRRTKDITPSKVLGEKGVIAPNVKRAVHSLSLDDNRMWTFPMSFNPVLMGAEDKVNEAWFAGEHGDVGGCFLSKGLTDFSIEHMMEWMASSEKLGEDSKLSFLKPEQVSSASLKTGYPNLEIPNEALSIAPDASDQTHLYDPQQTGDDPSYREIVLAQNDDIVPGGLVKIHKSVVLHMEARKQKGLFYPVNKNLKDANFVVVGSLGEELESETKKLAELLKEPAPVMTAAEKEQYLSTDKNLLLS